MRVALITTGQTERKGLPRALQALFPGHDFHAVDDRPGQPFRSFTSAALPPPPDVPPTATALSKLVAEAGSLVDPAVPDRWDLVVILDDLELANRLQPVVVVDCVRAAVGAHLDRYDAARKTAVANAFRERVSFHLAAPMIESWFFGAPHALPRLGVTSGYHIRPGDPEDFVSTDTAYIAEADTVCAEWCRRRRPKDARPKWIGAGPDRIFHPKGYLQWLLKDPQAGTCTTYDEAGTAAEALAALQWPALLGRSQAMGYARALIDDLATALGQPPNLTAWQGACSPLTSVSSRPAPHTLRNV